MFRKSFNTGILSTNSYLLACPKTAEGVMIDVPPESFEKIKQTLEMEDIKLKEIWLTHSHFDHTADLAKLAAYSGAKVFVHPADRRNVEEPGTDNLPLPFPVDPAKVDGEFSDGQELNVGHFKAKVIHIPGHTPGSVCFYFPEEKLLFTGDTLFHNSLSNLSYPNIDLDLMWQSLKMLADLPEDVVICSGHGPESTIGQEAWIKNAEERYAGV